MSIDLRNIVNGNFNKTKKYEFVLKIEDEDENTSKDIQCFVTLKKISNHHRTMFFNILPMGELEKMDVGDKKKYVESIQETSDLLIEYGLDKKEHNLYEGELSVDFFEKLALTNSFEVQEIISEIMDFNGLLGKKK